MLLKYDISFTLRGLFWNLVWIETYGVIDQVCLIAAQNRECEYGELRFPIKINLHLHTKKAESPPS